ncbi:MAG: Gfo/Idh/MocA family oxidoreductase [Candidatus Dormibacteraeota bacterium]|nr:Gfo/Idh/MocA family oxidoreductase [Candidatus Dormibacteraeota bacterium]
MSDNLRVAVIGAGRWSSRAHLPGWQRCPGVDIAVVCDLDLSLAQRRSAEFGAESAATDYQEVIARADVDIVDVCTRDEHDPIVFAALEAGKHCLTEKPVAHRAADVWRAAGLARERGVKTKVGLTFRYAPAIAYMRELIQDGFCGTPFVFNGYEQNSQWLDPDNPADKRILKEPAGDDPVGGWSPLEEEITVSSLEGYGAPIIDIGLMSTGGEAKEVVGVLKNFVKERRRTNLHQERERINIDDGDVFIAKLDNDAVMTIQSSYVTVGNYPGVEARLYGDRGALICRIVDENGEWQRLWSASADQVEFQRMEIPSRHFPPGYVPGHGWEETCYGNLIKSFVDEISTGGTENQGDFVAGAKVQEIINAVERSHRSRAWTEVFHPQSNSR